MKVKTVVKSHIHSTKTTLRSPQKHSPSSVATITSPTTLASPSSTPQATHKLQSTSAFVTPRPSVPHTSTLHTAVIPHPSDIQWPTTKPEGFYLMIVGKEVSIFYTWKDTAAQVLEISGTVHYKCKTFQQALADSTAAYRKGELHAIPTPGGPFWPTAPCMPLPVLSEGKQSYWAEVDDLSDVFSQVQLNPTGNRWVSCPS
ncbi:hypothetical protein PISMIDRAFT_108403 [Pisolithus microcarpus 441]|uniref:Uncharacterized protein n=1 Tax=Pisolithus microcarpus 441 TaxID=765257 RepID=A0A0C9YYR3_9AGAM|nr:hypothetical protein BKA83DRAFT_108403 [Pisolithus microcarpus]KIK19059.1 hypothetical protein PISMIDRAFT_108403 [Pisolithus microcarpus 441]